MDTISVESTKSDESINELMDYYDNPDNWFVEGKVVGFGSTDTIELVFKSMST